ncbi:MAG: AraC family transcriptional regulator [Ilumatobacteraceae bacterium]
MSKNGQLPFEARESERHPGGAVIDRHWHDNHQLVYVSSGVIAVQTESGGWVAASDRAVWIPANSWHQHRFYGTSNFHCVGFPTTQSPLTDTDPVIVNVDLFLRELIVAYTDPDLDDTEADRIRIVICDRLRLASQQPVSLPIAFDARLAEACAIAQSELQQPIPLDVLARRASTSGRTLARLYRSEFGTTYPQWRNNVRVHEAMILLAQGHTVTDTAHRCGWATTSHFIDTFRRITSRTPGSYRPSLAFHPRMSTDRRPEVSRR